MLKSNMNILTYVREDKKGKLKRFKNPTEEYWDLNDLTEYIDDAKIVNSFLNSLSFKEPDKLMKEFKKFMK